MVERSALEVVPPKVRAQVEQNIGPEENVHIALVGASNQTLIALDYRLIIVKLGFMAGATFGGRVTSFNYRDITAFEVNTGWTTGVVEILASGYLGGKEKDYWASDKDRDPFKMSNCVPIPKKAAAQWQPYLQWIRERIEEAHRPHPTPEPQAGAQQDDTGDVVAALERLQALKGAGALSVTEFELAKQKVLGAASGNFDSQSPTPAAQEDTTVAQSVASPPVETAGTECWAAGCAAPIAPGEMHYCEVHRRSPSGGS